MPRAMTEPAHGTDSGYKLHLKRRQLACAPCLHAHAVYHAERNKRGKCARGLGWPLETPPLEVSR